MGSSMDEKVVAVIMVGGPTKGNLSQKMFAFLLNEYVSFGFVFFENIYYITYPPTILVRMVMCFWFCPNLGSTTGTRFRPLSLNIPKPLFPIAGQPMVHHPISACKRVCFISLQFQFSTLDQWMMMMRAILLLLADSKLSSNLSCWFLWGKGVCTLCLCHLQRTQSSCQVLIRSLLLFA